MHSHVPAQKQHRIFSPYSVHIFLICTLIHSSRRKLCPTCDLQVQINYLLPFLSKAEASIQIGASQRQLRSAFMCSEVWAGSCNWENDGNLLDFGSEPDLFPESSYACRSEIRLETDVILYNIKEAVICLTETTVRRCAVHSWLAHEFKTITLRIFWTRFLRPALLGSAPPQVWSQHCFNSLPNTKFFAILPSEVAEGLWDTASCPALTLDFWIDAAPTLNYWKGKGCVEPTNT